MGVVLETNVAIDLVQLKLSKIRETIDEILQAWKENDPDVFVKKARTGELEEAEMDAITLRQLLLDLEKFQEMLKDFEDHK